MKTKINKPLNPKNIVAAKPGSIKIDKSNPLVYNTNDLYTLDALDAPISKSKMKMWYEFEAEDFTE